jgi:formyltetrahydrofolate synthetase
VRALKLHGGAAIDSKDAATWKRPDPEAARRGCANLAKHIEIIGVFGLPAIVAINRFDSDTPEEISVVRAAALAAGAAAAVPVEVWGRGGEGGLELAEAVLAASAKPARFAPLYALDAPIEAKIEAIATRIYGAAGVTYSDAARDRLDFCRREGYAGLPICMAKTPLSLSHDPKIKGRPEGFVLPISEARIAAGAGFIYPLAGSIMTMPGLSPTPAAEGVDVDENGAVSGLF